MSTLQATDQSQFVLSKCFSYQYEAGAMSCISRCYVEFCAHACGCSHLTKIVVTTTTRPGWVQLADKLERQQLPNLQQLHIQHSENLGVEDLLQLQDILKVSYTFVHCRCMAA
jgi:hypothetical protein